MARTRPPRQPIRPAPTGSISNRGPTWCRHRQDPVALRENTLDLAAIYLASGIKRDQAMFIQSHVSAHAELAWIFECFTPIGWLERMTQFKDRTGRQGRERIGAGVLTYPSLMAADIMLYDAKYLPVGEDQRH